MICWAMSDGVQVGISMNLLLPVDIIKYWLDYRKESDLAFTLCI